MARPGRLVVCAAGLLAACVVIASAGATAQPQRAGSRVTAVSNPPAAVPHLLTLRVSGGAGSVSVYASPARRLVKGSVLLAKRAAVKGRRVSLRVPSSLPAGTWFIVVCPAGGRSGCAASHHVMLKAPTKLAPAVSARPVTQTAQAASGTIGSFGGTLSAQAANGTRFLLTVPAKSVPDGTQITMTPLTALTNAKWFGTLIGGVQLAPEGLALVHGATLTITPKTRVPAADQVAAGYSGDGSDLHEVPLAPSRIAIVIPLSHFSGAGLGRQPGGASLSKPAGTSMDAYNSQMAGIVQQYRAGNLSESDMQAAIGLVLNAMYNTIISTEVPAGAKSLDAAESAISDLLYYSYVAALYGVDDNALAKVTPTIAKLLDAMYRLIMSTEVPPGLNDDDAAQQAITDLLRYAHDSALLGINTGALAKVLPTIKQLADGIYDRAQTKCADNHDFTQITKILKVDHDEQAFGLAAHGFTEDFKCLTFQVDFDSSITITPGGGSKGTFYTEYAAKLTIRFTDLAQDGTPFITGSTTGSFTQAKGSVTDDDLKDTSGVMQGGTGAPFYVDQFTIASQPQNPTLVIVPLDENNETNIAAWPSEDMTWNCFGQPTAHNTTDWWYRGWGSDHSSEMAVFGEHFAFGLELQSQPGAVIAQRTWSISADDPGSGGGWSFTGGSDALCAGSNDTPHHHYDETTTVEVTHTPGS